jgi:hypothetical protein
MYTYEIYQNEIQTATTSYSAFAVLSLLIDGRDYVNRLLNFC